MARLGNDAAPHINLTDELFLRELQYYGPSSTSDIYLRLLKNSPAYVMSTTSISNSAKKFLDGKYVVPLCNSGLSKDKILEIEKGFQEKCKKRRGRNPSVYVITQKGIALLDAIDEIRDFYQIDPTSLSGQAT